MMNEAMILRTGTSKAVPLNHASTQNTYGVSDTEHYGHAMATSTIPKRAGTASTGTETSKFARGDHIHPAQITISGNAGTATKLKPGARIGITGGATGSLTDFDGSEDIYIPVTSVDPKYLKTSLPIEKGGTGAISASAALTNLGIAVNYGIWTPILASKDGTDPAYNSIYCDALHFSIGNLVYITFKAKFNISNPGTGHACVKGLPFVASDRVTGQSLSCSGLYGAISINPGGAGFIPKLQSYIELRNIGGDKPQSWQSGELFIGFSGCYLKS